MPAASPNGLDFEWTFELTPLHHAYLDQLIEELDRNGLEGLYGVSEGAGVEQVAAFLHQLVNSRAAWDELEHKNSSLRSLDPAIALSDAPVDLIAFSQDAPHRLYNWELFVHIPLRIAERLREQGHFPAALRWLRLVLDPVLAVQPFKDSANDDANVDEAWRARPLWDPTSFTDIVQKHQRWSENPFDVHAVAECDPGVYRFAIARQYVETLIAWGDELFSRDTMESIAEATQVYLYALAFLGPRPAQVNLRTQRGSGLTFAMLRTGQVTPDGLRNPLVELENLLTYEESGEPTIRLDTSSIDPSDTLGYFCEPRNDRHLQLWDLLDDRLYKIRHCMNIDGIVRELPIFEPPIDPGALVAGVAAGLDLSELRPTRWVSPHVRFGTMLSLAKALTQSVQRLSGAVLQALQSRDGEALAVLRQQHEMEVLQLAGDIRRMQVDQARLSKAAIRETRKVVQARYDHYEALIDDEMLPAEIMEETLLDASQAAALDASNSQSVAATAAISPRFHTQAVATGTSYGGEDFARVASYRAQMSQTLSTQLSLVAAKTGRVAQRIRRRQEWKLQLELAKAELDQIDAQLEAADKQIDVAARELENHRRQVAMAREIDRQLRTRFTNQELYAWTVGQLTQLHSRTFQLALEVARKAEVCFRRELGIAASNYVGTSHWNASRKGLLAGDKLMADLERMEVAFVEQDRRELEITRHISLHRLDPQALLTLRATGSCTFDVPEVLFDLDFPGHYFRRMKAVTVSIPCLDGSEQQVNATLTLLRSEVRVETVTDAEVYKDGGRVQERWSERVALSGSRDDSGTFMFDLRDPKYLPFEHRGAISQWNLELAGHSANAPRPQFDWDTISDVVLHMRYTARHDEGMRSPASDSVKEALEAVRRGETPGTLQLGLSFRHDAPDAWNALLSADVQPNTPVLLRMPFRRDRLPYVIAALQPSIAQAHVILWSSSGQATADVSMGINIQGDPDVASEGPRVISGMTAYSILGAVPPAEPWMPGDSMQVVVALTNLTAVKDNRVDPEELWDVFVLLDLDFGTFSEPE